MLLLFHINKLGIFKMLKSPNETITNGTISKELEKIISLINNQLTSREFLYKVAKFPWRKETYLEIVVFTSKTNSIIYQDELKKLALENSWVDITINRSSKDDLLSSTEKYAYCIRLYFVEKTKSSSDASMKKTPSLIKFESHDSFDSTAR